MQRHTAPHVHVHWEIPKEIYEELTRIHPSYGERSRIIRNLLAAYVARRKADSQQAPEKQAA